MYEDCKELLTYRDLNLAALRSGDASCLLVYYLLRDFDRKGKGYVDYSLFIRYLNSLGFTRNHFYTARKNPSYTKFFEYHNSVGIIEYRSLEKVCLALACKPGIGVYLPMPALKTLRKVVAHFYATLFVTRKGRSVILSRERITELTGLCKQTQINYERLIKIDVSPNLACAIVPENIHDQPHLKADYINSLPCRDIPYSESGRRIVWQLPNNYLPKYIHAVKGRKHRANRRIKNLDDGLEAQANGERAGSSRIFYRHVDSTLFTDQQSSYIQTNYQINQGTQKYNLYRFNFFAPTNDPSIAVPNMILSQHKLVIEQPDNPKYKIQEETLL